MNRKISSLLIKICILVGAFFLGLAARSHAQTIPPGANPADTTHHRYGMHRGMTFNRDHHQDPNGWARHSREHIHFTPEQRDQATAINKDYRQKAADLFKQDNLTLKQYKAGLLALQKEKKDKISALLTQQQKDQQAAQRQRHYENRQVREAAHLERLKLRLNLTDDQVAKLKSGQEALHTQARAIHDNDNLLPPEKTQQMHTLIAKRNDTYRSVLTPDQYSQFEKMFHHRSDSRFGRPGRHFNRPGGPDNTGGHDSPGGPAGPADPHGSAAI
jgi:protein-disulfide isomerase-like protein with CxxC motif